MATEDYFSKSMLFKLRKVVRYVELYGLSRTLVKVRAQYHMQAPLSFAGNMWENPKANLENGEARTVGIIGCGAFSYGVIGNYVAREQRLFLRGAMDISKERARSFVEKFGGAYATVNAEEVITDGNIDLIFIASNHESHAEYAIRAIQSGKHVHIEKPHVVTTDQLSRLQHAMEGNPHINIYLGFNRPRSFSFKKLKQLLSHEEGTLMINWFIAGHKIDDNHWYFKPEEGGRILGNLCHWTDLTLELIPFEGRWPITISARAPVGSKSDFLTTLEFGDGSMAAITFSAKGHTFEGVREILNVHRGDLLAEIKDFKSLSISRGPRRKTWKTRYRDHGHQENIVYSYRNSRGPGVQAARERQHVIDTARLFLAVKQAHEEGRTVVLEGPDPEAR